MIFVFHSLYFLLRHFLQAYNKSKVIDDLRRQHFFLESEVNFNNTCRFEEDNVLFDPPIYRLRYAAVQQVLLHEAFRTHVTKIVDFGCGELNLFQYLKRLYGVQDILCVDVDEDLLKEYVSKVHPLTIDYLKRRNEPLQVQLLCGSIGDPDRRLKGSNAVVCVEIIEHLYPDVLEALPYNIFHFIRPLVAVFTTPNADFNVLFPNPGKFRHPDHKFEWTRLQFQDWGNNVTVRFPNYTVIFEGIGQGPPSSAHLGCCTQMAIFVRRDDEQLCEVPRSCREIASRDVTGEEATTASHGICTYFSYSRQISRYDECVQGEENSTGDVYYKLIEKVEYPYEVDKRSPQEKILQEILYKVYKYTSVNSRFYDEETEKIQLPLRELTSNEEGYYTTIPEVQKLLEKEGFKIEECNVPGSSEPPALCVIYDPNNMDNRSPSPGNESNSSEEKNDRPKLTYASNDETDWDLDQAWKLNLERRQNEPDHKINDSSKSSSLEETGKPSEPNLAAENSEQRELKVHVDVNVTGGATVNGEHENAPQHRSSKDLDSTKKTKASSHSKAQSESSKRAPKKGTNTKNSTSQQGSSKEPAAPKKSPPEREVVLSKRTPKRSCDAKVNESTHSIVAQGGPSVSNSNNPSLKPPQSVSSTPQRKSVQKKDESLPGTSDVGKKKKKLKKPESVDDIRDITECILYNSLNKISDELVIQDIVEVVEEQQQQHIEDVIQVQPVPVENGDLANNNRDLEGNNYPDEVVEFEERPNEDKVNDNVQQIEAEQEAVRNQDFQNRNNDGAAELDIPQDRREEDLALGGQELNHASREALFDPNSEVDMLEEFELPSPSAARPTNTNTSLLESRNVILISINQTTDEDNVALPENAEPFPNWLLQLLGANVEEGESHDEPHFYCQGDGIGVHPSIVEVEIDEEQSTSESSSSNDEAEAERTISEPGVGPLPSDEIDGETLQMPNESLAITGTPLVPTRIQAQNVSSPASNSTADSGDEYFDSVDETLLLDEASSRTNAQD